MKTGPNADAAQKPTKKAFSIKKVFIACPKKFFLIFIEAKTLQD
jgi:hypothetical protein